MASGRDVGNRMVSMLGTESEARCTTLAWRLVKQHFCWSSHALVDRQNRFYVSFRRLGQNCTSFACAACASAAKKSAAALMDSELCYDLPD